MKNYLKYPLFLFLSLISFYASAAVEVCSPPVCQTPKIIAFIQSNGFMQFLMLMSFISAWCAFNGLMWYFGFFPQKPMPIEIKINPTARAFWLEHQKMLKEETLKWQSEPELIVVRKAWGIRFLLIALSTFSIAFFTQKILTPNPAGTFFSVINANDLVDSKSMIDTKPKIYLSDNGKIKDTNGNNIGSYTALRDRIIAKDNTGNTSCWFWNTDFSELWAFNEGCVNSLEINNATIKEKITPSSNEKIDYLRKSQT